ncbi:MAG: EAL domain-containing protein [Actinomycetes bacterium]
MSEPKDSGNELRILTQRLSESERLFRLAMDRAPHGMALIGLDLKFQQVNQALRTMLGRDESWLLSHSLADVIHPDDRVIDLAELNDMLTGTAATTVEESRWVTGLGSVVWVIHSTALLLDAQDVPLFYVSHVLDNTDAHLARAELSYRTTHDPLTGLVNKDQLLEVVSRILHREPRRGGLTALLFCDLDYFNAVNDTYGHGVGDDVLRRAAGRVAAMVRAEDIVARLDGDEFVVVLNDVFDIAAAVSVAQKIRKAVCRPLRLEQHTVNITVSIGIAFASPGSDSVSLLGNANIALAEAKGSGRNRIVVSGHDSTSSIAIGISNGLRDGQFVPWFQPIVDLVTGDLTGYEALARWVRLDGSVTEPNDFLVVARRTTLIADLDLLVMRESIARLATLPEELHVAVNFSLTTLTSPDYPDLVTEELTQRGVDPTRLHLEFSESIVPSITESVRQAMSDLADTGVRWYIDNFGTGRSSISDLRELPIAGLKLDRSVTANLGSETTHNERISRALVGLGTALGLDTVAEGVETPEQAAIVTDQGWKHAQGWLYGRPEPL